MYAVCTFSRQRPAQQQACSWLQCSDHGNRGACRGLSSLSELQQGLADPAMACHYLSFIGFRRERFWGMAGMVERLNRKVFSFAMRGVKNTEVQQRGCPMCMQFKLDVRPPANHCNLLSLQFLRLKNGANNVCFFYLMVERTVCNNAHECALYNCSAPDIRARQRLQ